MSMDSVDHRYLHDPLFRALVDQMYGMIVNLQTTPTEIREAAMLAQMKFEMNSVQRMTFFSDPELQRVYDRMRKV